MDFEFNINWRGTSVVEVVVADDAREAYLQLSEHLDSSNGARNWDFDTVLVDGVSMSREDFYMAVG